MWFCGFFSLCGPLENGQFEPSFMKLGLTVVWRDVRDGVGSKFGGRGTRMIIPSFLLKSVFRSTKSNFYKPEVYGEGRK